MFQRSCTSTPTPTPSTPTAQHGLAGGWLLPEATLGTLMPDLPMGEGICPPPPPALVQG